MVRGMLPNKTGRGQKAHARLTCFDGCPPPYDVVKKFKIPAALKTVRSRPGRKVASLGRLCHEIGWQYQDVVGRLEAKRLANAEEWYKKSEAKKAKRCSAVKACSKKTAAIDAQ